MRLGRPLFSAFALLQDGEGELTSPRRSRAVADYFLIRFNYLSRGFSENSEILNGGRYLARRVVAASRRRLDYS